MIDERTPEPGDTPLTLRLTRRERHDFYTPLNQIVGYCELMIEEAADADPAPANLETVRKVLKAANDLHRCLNEVLSRAVPDDDRSGQE